MNRNRRLSIIDLIATYAARRAFKAIGAQICDPPQIKGEGGSRRSLETKGGNGTEREMAAHFL